MSPQSFSDPIQSEADLIARAQAGDRPALEALLGRLQGKLYRFTLRMCGTVEDAEEVLQETLLAIARSVKDFRGDARISTWAYSIARRTCIKRRRLPINTSLDDENADTSKLVADDGGQEDNIRDQEILGALNGALHVLDEESRAVLLLRDVEGLSAQQTAEALQMSVAKVKSRLHRARGRLRQHILPVLAPASSEESQGKPGCPDIVDAFSRYLEDEIDSTMCQQMQEHVAGCEFCKRTCDSLQRTITVCNAMPTPQVPRNIQTAVRHYIRRHVDADNGSLN